MITNKPSSVKSLKKVKVYDQPKFQEFEQKRDRAAEVFSWLWELSFPSTHLLI